MRLHASILPCQTGSYIATDAATMVHSSAQKLTLQHSIQHNCIACQETEVAGVSVWPTAGEVVHPWSCHPLAQ